MDRIAVEQAEYNEKAAGMGTTFEEGYGQTANSYGNVICPRCGK
jgi:hypothetical protein